MSFAIRRHPEAFSLDPSARNQRRIEDAGHLAFIRLLPSIVSGEFGVEACHIRAGSPVHRKKRTGAGQKSDDCWTLPLTPAEHREQHGENEMEFWRRHGIDPFEAALKLYAVTPDVQAGIRVIREIRSPLFRPILQEAFHADE